MQYDRHIEGITTAYKAIDIPQPLADALARGEQDSFTRGRGSDYRGEVLIVSQPGGERGGIIVGRAILTSICKNGRKFTYHLADAERMVEFPCQKCDNKEEVWPCFYTANTLTPYPKINISRWIPRK